MMVRDDANYTSKTIKFAFNRLQEETYRNEQGCENGQLILYWAAYRDGALAQRTEDRLLIDELLAELGREHPEKRLAYERRFK